MAALSTAAAVVSATVAVAGGAMAYKDRKAAEQLLDEEGAFKKEKAGDLLTQVELEEGIYADDIESIRKATNLAGEKLTFGTEASMENLGDQMSNLVSGSMGNKYSTGSNQKTMRRVESGYDEKLSDIKDSFDISMNEIELRNEEQERQAFIRHEEIVGSLEAQRKELLG